MKGLKFITVVISIIFGQVVIINDITRAEGLGKVGYCFDAAFHEETNRLYVTAGSAGTHVLDVNEGGFQFITTVQDGGYHRNLKISGDRAFVADAERGLVVYDITERIPIRTWQQQEQNVSGMGIYVHDNHAYLAGGKEGLYIFDVTNPDTPRRVSICKTNADAWDVWVSGKYAYVADLQKGATVVDVSQPSQPQKVALVTWDKIEPMAEIIRGEGDTAYVAAGKHGLVVLDISNPLDPKVISKYKSGQGGFGEGLCVKNSLVYLSNGNNESKDENGLIVIDAKDPHSLEVKGRCTFGNWVEGVCLSGNHVFVTNTYSGVRSIDISDPSNPQLVDSIGAVKKNDPLLESEISDEEARAVEEYRRIKSQILSGDSYNDSSTPLRAVLTRFSSWEPDERDYFIGLDIFRAPLPPAKLEEGSLWPVFAGDIELADTFVLVYAKGRWIWVGNVGNNYDWRLGKSTFEKWAREKIGQSVPSDDSGNASSADARAPEESVGNRVLSLDGEGDFVQIANSQSLHSFSNAITIEVWFKVSSFYPENGMVNSIIRKNITAQAENFFLRVRNVDGRPSMEMSIGYDIPVLKAPYDFAVDTWYHLAGTYDGSAITVFVNGLSIKSEKASGSLYIDDSDLFIGKGDPEFSLGEFFHGTLDELRIWNVARSPEEIQAAINSPLTGGEDGLVVYLNFDDGTAKDLSGHSNDGLLNADAQIVESPFPVSLESKVGEPGKLVAWWKFDNDANDSAGDNNGTINGNPAYVDGKVGQAISLEGDDYVDFGNPDSLNFGTGDWTISAWIKTTQTGTNQDDALMNRGTVFANGGDEAGGIRYALAINEAQLGSITLTTDNDMSKVQVVSRTAVNDGAWHHIVGMRNAGQLHIYVDGVLDGGNYLSDGYDLSGTSQHNAYIGVITDNRDGSLYKYFVGLIDEVCIIHGAIDANGVRALCSGEDPVNVAQKAIISRAKPLPRARQVTGDVADRGIEGDWQVVSNQVGQNVVIEIRKRPDGTLSATGIVQSSNGTTPDMLLDEVSFQNGKLYFKGGSPRGVFEGTMKEDGVTIEGQFQQQGQTVALVLKRIIEAPSEAVPPSQEQIQARTSGAGNIVTVLILVLALAGVVGAIVYFLVKSSIR